MQGCILFMNLKKLNRLAHMRLKRGRDQTHEVTQEKLLNASYHFIICRFFATLTPFSTDNRKQVEYQAFCFFLWLISVIFQYQQRKGVNPEVDCVSGYSDWSFWKLHPVSECWHIVWHSLFPIGPSLVFTNRYKSLLFSFRQSKKWTCWIFSYRICCMKFFTSRRRSASVWSLSECKTSFK